MRTALDVLNVSIVFISLALASCNRVQTNLPKNAIVSTTLCADGYLHAFPELEPRIAALSWQSRSNLSQTPEHLKALPQTDNDIERRLNWSSAIQISSAGGAGNIDLIWGENFETVWKNLALLSIKLNAHSPANSLKFRMESIKKPDVPPRILYLDRSGATAGPGTFVHAVIEAAGAVNIIDNPGWQSLDTETLIGLKPDIIVTSFMGSKYAGINDRTLRHTALASKINALPRVDIPGRYWPCAGPGLVDAVEHLSHAMNTL